MIFHCRKLPLHLIRTISIRVKRRASNSASDILSENFFSTENRCRIVDRLKESASLKSIDSRITNPKSLEKDNLRQAAVLVPLVDVGGVASILFTVRSGHLSAHRGEISFPGGSVDDVDGGSAEKAALREAQEEIGVDPNTIDMLGPLGPQLSRMGDTLVKPFVGVIRGGFDTSAFTQRQHKGAEVWAVFTQDLSALSHRDNLSFTQFRSGYSLPIFSARGYRIWGLTAIILHNALKVLVPKIYRPVVRYTRPLV